MQIELMNKSTVATYTFVQSSSSHHLVPWQSDSCNRTGLLSCTGNLSSFETCQSHPKYNR